MSNTNFPTSLDTNPGNPTPTEALSVPPHSFLHGFAQDAIVAIENYVGATASAVSSSITYLLTNASSIDPGHKHTVASGGTGLYGAIAKGVILAGNATGFTKVSVGADGQALLADSTQAPGVSWQYFLPPGITTGYAGSSAPAGWLFCDGSAKSRTTYAALFAAIGTAFGAGDGSTTFNLPDARGRVEIGAGTGVKTATITGNTGNVFTVSGITNAPNNEFQTGEAVVFNATTAGNLVNGTTYYVVRITNTTFSVASSLANAQNTTVITLAGTEAGSFTLTLTNRTIGDTVGEENHAMSISELLAHVHNSNTAQQANAGGSTNTRLVPGSVSTGSAGGNAAMNVMQPGYVANKIIKT